MKRGNKALYEKIMRKIAPEIKRVINEIYSGPKYPSKYWQNSNDNIIKKAIEDLSDAIIEEYGTECIENAIDIDKCDSNDIQTFYSIVCDEDSEYINYEISHPFSIKEFNENNKRYGIHSIFEDFVNDYWTDILDDDVVESIYDVVDIASITNRNDYGGGSFEAIRELQLAVADNVANKIKHIIYEKK